MQVNWIVENWAKESSYEELCRAVLDEGHTLTRVRDFQYADWTSWQNRCAVFCGSIEMTKLMKKALDTCQPVAWNTGKNYLCSTYYSRFGPLLFNDRYAMMSLSELARNKFLYYGLFGRETKLFVRPDSGDKTFQAQLIDMQEIDACVEKNAPVKHDLVLVSTPKTIRGEYRFVVTANGIVANSTYRYQGLSTYIPSVPRGATEECEEVLEKNWLPDPVCVVDIAEDGDGDFWLLEFNSFSSAGLYSCNKRAIVKAVSQLALDDFTLDKQPSLP